MDRNNTSIVMIAGMSVDLSMTGPRYSIIVLLFFVPYVVFQPLTTVILRKIGPPTVRAINTLLWGMATIASGFAKTSELIPLRLILGTSEAGFFLSKWLAALDVVLLKVYMLAQQSYST